MSRDINKKDVFLGLFFLIFLLVPLLYTDLTLKKVPFLPQFWSSLYSTSNLFTQANYLWPHPYIQIKKDDRWITLNEADYFRMPTFGYRTRLFEALFPGDYNPDIMPGAYRELAQWIVLRYKRLYPEDVIQAVRFSAVLHEANLNRRPQSHWSRPSGKEIIIYEENVSR